MRQCLGAEMDFSFWDSVDELTLLQAAYLWHDMEPQPCPRQHEEIPEKVSAVVWMLYRGCVKFQKYPNGIPIEVAMAGPHSITLSRQAIKAFAELKGYQPDFLFPEVRQLPAIIKPAQAHEAALARHSFTAAQERSAKEKARELWSTDPTISQARMRQLCGDSGKLCPKSWVSEVRRSMNLPRNQGGRPKLGP